VPPPTWSMNDLHLEATPGQEQPTIRDDELDILAQRCLIDVQQLSEQERNELKIGVGKIMKCISLVCETDIGSDADSLTEEEMYDSPRGFHKISCPVRSERSELEAWKKDGGAQEDARYILQQLKESKKTVRVKANECAQEETFFSIVTESGKEEDHASTSDL